MPPIIYIVGVEVLVEVLQHGCGHLVLGVTEVIAVLAEEDAVGPGHHHLAEAHAVLLAFRLHLLYQCESILQAWGRRAMAEASHQCHAEVLRVLRAVLRHHLAGEHLELFLLRGHAAHGLEGDKHGSGAAFTDLDDLVEHRIRDFDAFLGGDLVDQLHAVLPAERLHLPLRQTGSECGDLLALVALEELVWVGGAEEHIVEVTAVLARLL